MFLRKIKIFDDNKDSLKYDLGKQLEKSNGNLVESQGRLMSLSSYGPSYIEQPDNLYAKRQTMLLRGSRDTLEGVSTSGPFSYHYAELVIPESRNLIATNDETKGVSSGRVTAKFNFVSEQYENFTNLLDEVQLPCIYLESDPAQTESIMDLKFFPRTVLKARYFYDFDYILAPRYQSPDVQQFRNLLFGQNFSFNVANGEKEQYPFYNRIRFNYNTTHDFKNILKKYNFFEHFIDDYMNSGKNTIQFLLQTKERGNSDVQRQGLKAWDMTSWLQKSDFFLDDTNKVIFEPTVKHKSNYQYFADKLAFAGAIRKFSKSKVPSIEDIINNKPVESETLFYKIEKWTPGINSPIQTFWIPADDDYIDYVDTQIKYGEKYEYRVSAFILIFGCEYKYINKQTRNNGTRVLLDAEITPSFQVVEVPNIYSDICRVIQPPQPVPTVKFVNERNARDYLKIYLDLCQNSENDPLVIINEEDAEQEELREEYDRLEERSRFVYNNESALFEIYRTDFKPSSFRDLSGYKIADIRNGLPSTGASLKDYVRPFKKYYYVFRSVNFHGLVSNPTPIYEVELKKDADETFLFSKTVGFFKETTTQPTRKFIKLMQAIPATQHTIFDPSVLIDKNGEPLTSLKGTAINNMTLGVAEHPIWGKKFKFRITSTTTGKKLDINIMVNLIKKKTLENSK